MKTGTYTTGTGATLKIRPIPPYTIEHYRLNFQRQFDTDHPAPEKPTYRVETAGGGFEIHDHDDSTVETPEEQAALLLWKDHHAQRDAFVNTKILEAMIIEGVDADPNADQGWLRRKKFFGVAVPEDELELKLFYVREHMVLDQTDGGDYAGLPDAMSQLMGVPTDAVEASKRTFRRSPRKTGRAIHRGAESAQETGVMVHDSEIHGNGDGEGVGIAAEPVG